MDFALPVDRRVKIKENEKMHKNLLFISLYRFGGLWSKNKRER